MGDVAPEMREVGSRHRGMEVTVACLPRTRARGVPKVVISHQSLGEPARAAQGPRVARMAVKGQGAFARALRALTATGILTRRIPAAASAAGTRGKHSPCFDVDVMQLPAGRRVGGVRLVVGDAAEDEKKWKGKLDPRLVAGRGLQRLDGSVRWWKEAERALLERPQRAGFNGLQPASNGGPLPSRTNSWIAPLTTSAGSSPTSTRSHYELLGRRTWLSAA
jgi:hypothetical protein